MVLCLCRSTESRNQQKGAVQIDSKAIQNGTVWLREDLGPAYWWVYREDNEAGKTGVRGAVNLGLRDFQWKGSPAEGGQTPSSVPL